jgi:hypothetical protein
VLFTGTELVEVSDLADLILHELDGLSTFIVVLTEPNANLFYTIIELRHQGELDAGLL